MYVVRWLLAVILFAAIPFVAVHSMSQDAPPRPPSVQSEQQQAEDPLRAQSGYEQGTEFWPSISGYRLKVSDTLLIAVTFLLFGATVALWLSTRALVRGAETTAKRQLRAYVSATVARCDEPATRDGIFILYLEIVNTGQTPAHDVKIITRTDVFDYPFGDDFDFTLPQQENASVSVLGSQQKTEAESHSDPMTSGTWASITSDDSGKRLCTYGTVSYRDVFGDLQYTNICIAHLIKVLDRKTGRISISGHVAQRHNEAS